MWDTWVLSLGSEDPLEEEMATHSSILAYEIRWTPRGAWWAPVQGLQRVDMTERLSIVQYVYVWDVISLLAHSLFHLIRNI